MSDHDVIFLVADASGAVLNDLVLAMRDRAIPPMQLWSAKGELRELYKRCVALTQTALDGLGPDGQSGLRTQLPWHLREEDGLADVLVENAVHGPYFELDLQVFQHGRNTDRLYRAHPELHALVDGDGLLPVEGFDARPQVLMHNGSALQYHPLLRRHFTSHINDTLLSTVLTAAATSPTTARIALNEQHFMPAAD